MRRTRRPFLCLLALFGLGLGGCVTWRPYEATLSEGQPLPSSLRATRRDSSQVSFTDPVIRGDTLYGRVAQGRPMYGRAWGDSVGLPVADIAHLERERVSIGRTLGVVVGVPAAFLGVTYLVVCFNGCPQPTY
jgi:hypothetical protein